MNRKHRTSLWLILLAGLVVIGLGVFLLWQYYNGPQATRARFDAVFARTSVPEDWVQAGGKPINVVDGTKKSTAVSTIGSLTFTTSATVQTILDAYTQFAIQQQWKRVVEDKNTPLLVFETNGGSGRVYVKVISTDPVTTVRLEYLLLKD